MHIPIRRQWVVGVNVAIAAAAVVIAAPASAHGDRHGAKQDAGPAIQRTDLVSDQAGKAAIQDPDLVNAWGMSRGPNTPIWVSDNGADVSTLYRGAMGSTPVSSVGLVVSTPGGAPTGQVFNDTSGFVVPGTTKPALFIFAGEDGDLSAWNQAVSPATQAIAVGHANDTVYKGLALAHSPFGPLLLAANFHANRIDVFDSTFTKLSVDGLFRDGNLPDGYAPFNVAEVGNRVFVTYAKQDPARKDDVPGAGHGFVDVYTNYGVLLHRFASGGVLDSPWGLAVAPPSFGEFAGDVLVGNFGDGRIHAFDLRTGELEGTLSDAHHHAIEIDGLWGLLVGDAMAGGDNSVWFSAGPDGEAHGLLGILRAG